MRRTIANLIIAASVAVIVLLSAAWVRSYSATDEVQRRSEEISGDSHAIWRSIYRVGSQGGKVYLAREIESSDLSWDTEVGRTLVWRYVGRDSYPDYPLQLALECQGIAIDVPRPPSRFLGFGGRTMNTASGLLDCVVVPYGALVVGVAMVPVVLLVGKLRGRRQTAA